MIGKAIYIDVREPFEFSAGHVENAINVPLGYISQDNESLQSIDKSTKVVMYCRSGARAEQAKSVLQSLGFTDVENGINQQSIEK